MCCKPQKLTVMIEDFSFSLSGYRNDVETKVCLWGDLSKPLIVLMGGISADRYAFTTKYKSGWWDNVLNEDSILNTDNYSFLTFDYICLSNHNEKQHLVTTVDQANALKSIKEVLDLPHFHAVIGSSYGGMVSLAFASKHPSDLEQLVCIAAADKNSVKSQALRFIQRRIIQLGESSPCKKDESLALARSLAIIGYRGEEEFESKFQTETADATLNSVSNYLAHQGRKVTDYFSASRYLQLSESIDHHQIDVSKINTPTNLIAFTSDQMVPIKYVKSLHNKIAANCEISVIDSHFGHDGFLLEDQKLNSIFYNIFNSIKYEHNYDTIKPNHRCASGH